MADEQKGRLLTDEESKEVRLGLDLEEMTKTAGWQTVMQWLQDRSFHSWIDPRGTTKEEWDWAELNAFHSADVSKQLIMDVERLVTRAHYLRSVQLGEVKDFQRMKI